MKMNVRLCGFLLQATLASIPCAMAAHAQPGHGGLPPGQAKKQEDGGLPPGQAKKYDEGRPLPPGQAKKLGDWRFRDDDRGRFYSYYRDDADRWRARRRPVFVPGEPIPRTYAVHVVPQQYWVGVPPPPPGYQYGYYGGYVVAYDPATRVIGDVLDLIGAATGR